jgi:hypothetical protein
MKTSFLKTGRLFLTLGLCLISLIGNSQDTKLTRQERKEARRDKQYSNFQVIDSLLQHKSFVLEADFLDNMHGARIPVMSDVNFVMVDSLRAVLQTGVSNSNPRYNGVGGVTAEGKLSGLKIVKNEKNLSFFLRFTVVTDIGIYDVVMTIYSNNSARASISGLTPGKLVYDGRIKSLWESRVYKGRNTI